MAICTFPVPECYHAACLGMTLEIFASHFAAVICAGIELVMIQLQRAWCNAQAQGCRCWRVIQGRSVRLSEGQSWEWMGFWNRISKSALGFFQVSGCIHLEQVQLDVWGTLLRIFCRICRQKTTFEHRIQKREQSSTYLVLESSCPLYIVLLEGLSYNFPVICQKSTVSRTDFCH